MAYGPLASQGTAWLSCFATSRVAAVMSAAPGICYASQALFDRKLSSFAASTSQATQPNLHGLELPPRLRNAKTNVSEGGKNWNGLQSTRRYCRRSTFLKDDTKNLSPLPPGIVGVQSTGAQERGWDVSSLSQVIFDSCWRRFEEKYRLLSIHVPREIVCLNGAPGAGKGANTQHILKTRGLEHSICVSSLLTSHPDSRDAINRGDMIPDTVVGDVLLEALLVNSCRAPECGVLIDGFPRTSQQVDFLKLLYDKLSDLHVQYADSPHEAQFPRPLIKVVMLYVDEETSIARQMERAKLATLHNKRVMDAGAGDLMEQRATDMSLQKCKKRYAVFKQHYTATLRLKQFFPFHLIDAMGSLAETQEAITTELRYQSSLDLSQATYQAIRHLPLARDLVQHARQQLVSRLDDHSEKYPHLFQKVIDIITAEIMPVLRESGMSGQVEYVSDLRIFNDHPRTAQMLIDILTDRGFNASHSAEVEHVPVQVDLTTGLIKNRKETKHRFSISWDSRNVRDMAKAIELATRMAETAAKDTQPRISQSFIPPTPPPPPRPVGTHKSTAVAKVASTQNAQPDESAASEPHVIYGS
mmetsp:Transcript_26912/g.58761  ORF Transcript_26912/g.58761 Transcript_26912/m.58761 type:complete len:585 (+) Transcript_26912:197-1951(+)|eukprot:CAMPEP_0202891370 /NCGR_PEP_ID=MMETSP1392-20130828/1449_1 /ASSEMBLY_ACC=CAM_ASM_000868 /TAXON_ID=225041 /ORGANISM="Chlamydomonas chlamydogama, Strain SAG 11-48b" /LENGTH=584 /DNA_ID=CAMNT_0049575099 /DNA_START=192 /DNA_END=1946 /DNA_ORIENTATION=+